jgi:polar amino acid transport system permease protein
MSSIVLTNVKTTRIVPRRRWGSWFLSAAVLMFLLLLVFAGIRAKILNVNIFLKYLTDGEILLGARNGLLLGTLALLLAFGIGLITALMRVSANPILSSLSAIYVYFFRGVPMLIQILFWYNAFPTMFPRLTIGMPFTGTVLIDTPMTTVVTAFLGALMGLGMAEGAYMSEIIRTGILAVDAGQRSAARAIGMTQIQVMRRIVLPQAGRIIIPAAGNQYISLLKSTSLASVIGYLELLRITQGIYSVNFQVVELLAVAAFWYLVMTAIATAIQFTFEKLFPVR